MSSPQRYRAVRFRLRPAARADRADARGRRAARAACCTSPAQRSTIAPSPDLPELLVPGDLLVFNDTKVIRSRLRGRKPSGGKVELLLERIVAPDEAWMQLAASHPPRPGGSVLLDGGATRPCWSATGVSSACGSRPKFRSTLISSATARCRCRRTSTAPRSQPIASATRPCTRAIRARSPRRRRACTSTTPLLARLARARRRVRVRDAARGRRHVPAGRRRGPCPASDAQRALHRSRRRPLRRSTAHARRAARRRGRHDVAARARIGGRRGRLRAGAAETELFITPGLSGSASSTGCSPIFICRARRC